MNCGATKNKTKNDVKATSSTLKVISHNSRLLEGLLEKKYVNVRNANAKGLARSWNQARLLTVKPEVVVSECVKAEIA